MHLWCCINLLSESKLLSQDALLWNCCEHLQALQRSSWTTDLTAMTACLQGMLVAMADALGRCSSDVFSERSAAGVGVGRWQLVRESQHGPKYRRYVHTRLADAKVMMVVDGVKRVFSCVFTDALVHCIPLHVQNSLALLCDGIDGGDAKTVLRVINHLLINLDAPAHWSAMPGMRSIYCLVWHVLTHLLPPPECHHQRATSVASSSNNSNSNNHSNNNHRPGWELVLEPAHVRFVWCCHYLFHFDTAASFYNSSSRIKTTRKIRSNLVMFAALRLCITPRACGPRCGGRSSC
jgi:hypothetical protein